MVDQPQESNPMRRTILQPSRERIVTLTRRQFWDAVTKVCPEESMRKMKQLAKMLEIDP